MSTYPIIPSETPAPGWVGGFSTSRPEFAYPKPDLSSLPMLANMANIPLLQRQLDVLWPEFSWRTQPRRPGHGAALFQRRPVPALRVEREADSRKSAS